jgi:hypothetical protein
LPTSWYIGTTLITATATELNKLSGVTASTSELNSVVGISDNIQQQLDSKLSSYNSSFTGTTIVDALQIGRSDSAIIIEGMTDVGTGLTVLKDGNPITYNFPAENLIQIQDIAIMKYPSETINLVAGVELDVTTSITTHPYYIELFDSSDNLIGSTVEIRTALSVGVYHIYITSSESLNNAELYILY